MALNPPLRHWQGRHAWVIGASSGIGLATAQALASRGARVTVSARRAEPLAAFVQAHPGAHAVALDVTDAPAVREAAARVSAGAALDLVLYCAGHYRAQRATALDLAQLREHLEINYAGALHVLDAVLPAMLARGAGHLSLVGSVAGYRGLPQGLAYGPTKAALINLAETLYTDLRPRGIGVSLISPGFVRTPLTEANDFPMPALITPERAAEDMLRGWARGAFEIHFPRRFTLGMKLLQLLPPCAFFPAVRRFTGL